MKKAAPKGGTAKVAAATKSHKGEEILNDAAKVQNFLDICKGHTWKISRDCIHTIPMKTQVNIKMVGTCTIKGDVYRYEKDVFGKTLGIQPNQEPPFGMWLKLDFAFVSIHCYINGALVACKHRGPKEERVLLDNISVFTIIKES